MRSLVLVQETNAFLPLEVFYSNVGKHCIKEVGVFGLANQLYWAPTLQIYKFSLDYRIRPPVGTLKIEKLQVCLFNCLCLDQKYGLLVDCLVQEAILLLFVLHEVGPVGNWVAFKVAKPLDASELLL